MKKRSFFTSILCVVLTVLCLLPGLVSCDKGNKYGEENSSNDKYTYMELDGNKYLVFVKYEDSMVKSADFYKMHDNQHDFGLEFEYNEDKRLTDAAVYYFHNSEKKFHASNAKIKYEEGEFKQLTIKNDSFKTYIEIIASLSGVYEVITDDDICIVLLDDNYLIKEFERTVFEKDKIKTYVSKFEFDNKQRITKVKKSGKECLEFVYKEESLYFSEIKDPTNSVVSYSFKRDENGNVVECQHVTENTEYISTYGYTTDGVQINKEKIERHSLTDHIYSYDEKGNIKQHVETEFADESKDKIVYRWTREYTGGENSYWFRKITEEFDKNGNLIKTTVDD